MATRGPDTRGPGTDRGDPRVYSGVNMYEKLQAVIAESERLRAKEHLTVAEQLYLCRALMVLGMAHEVSELFQQLEGALAKL